MRPTAYAVTSVHPGHSADLGVADGPTYSYRDDPDYISYCHFCAPANGHPWPNPVPEATTPGTSSAQTKDD